MSMFNVVPVVERTKVPQYDRLSLSDKPGKNGAASDRDTFDAAIESLRTLKVGQKSKVENALNYRLAIAQALGKGWECKASGKNVTIERTA